MLDEQGDLQMWPGSLMASLLSIYPTELVFKMENLRNNEESFLNLLAEVHNNFPSTFMIRDRRFSFFYSKNVLLEK